MDPEQIWPGIALQTLVLQAEHIWASGPQKPEDLHVDASLIRSRTPNHYALPPEWVGPWTLT